MTIPITVADAREAESHAATQRAFLTRFLVFDLAKCANPMQAEKAKIFIYAAEHDSNSYDAMLGQKDVGELFERGVLSFERDDQ